MSGFEILKFLHVLSAIFWLGGAFGIFVLQVRLNSAGDRAGMMAVGRQLDAWGKIYFSVLSLATLITGIAMIATTDGLSFTDTWVLVGFGGVVVTMGVGIGGIGPVSKKLVEEGQKAEPDGAAMAAWGQRIRTFTLINISILTVVVFMMVTRPG